MVGRITLDGAWLRLRWRLEGAASLIVPKFAGKGRADNLWQTTCFELFLQAEDEAGYIELNLSPSERWAAYSFTAPRENVSEFPMPREPDCTLRQGRSMAIFDAAVPLATLPAQPWRCGMTAVLEEAGGIKSYWALAHRKTHPDFHDPSCFLATVAAPQGA